MVLDRYRGWSSRVLTPLALKFVGMSPHALSVLSLVCAIVACLFFILSGTYFGALMVGVLFVFLNGFFDALDGRLAKVSNMASARGDLLDHAIDRYADFVMLSGLVLSGFGEHLWLALLALLGVFMTSYMGTQAQAVGAKRDYSGVLGRADRLALLIAIPMILDGLLFFSLPYSADLPLLGRFTLIDATMLWFAAAGNATAIVRGVKAWRHLK